jgi:hypothetical protein
MPKTVIVLGTYHQAQINGHHMNRRFGGAIDLIKTEYCAQIVLEEWRNDDQHVSFASTLASAELKWENVGTPNGQRFETLRDGLNCYPPTHDPSKPMLQEYGPLDAQEQRENYMVERVRAAMGNYEVGLFIVGNAHLHSVLSELKAIGFEVRGYSWIEQK